MESTSENTEVLVRFYTREGCHLCEQALDTVAYVRETYTFRLEIRSVDADPAWRQRYGGLVPVLLVGREQVHYRVQPAELRALLDAAKREGCWEPSEG